MKTVTRTFNNLGDSTLDLARTIGDGTVDIAKRFGDGTVDIAKRFSDGTVDIAKRVGPRRGLIGLAVLAAAVGGTIVLVRYIKARNAKQANLEGDAVDSQLSGGIANTRSRAKHAAQSVISHQ